MIYVATTKGTNMTDKLRGLWSVAAVAAISLALATTVASSKSAYAIEDATTTQDHSRMSETEHDASETNEKVRSSTKVRTEAHTEARVEAEKAVQERKLATREKLSTAKLKACEKRQASINNRTTSIADRGTKHLALFTKIADRVKTFYVTKGNVLENYDALVTEVDAKRVAAEAAVATIASSTTDFTCSEGNPQQSIDGFKTNLTLQHTALKEYQVAVKNLIVGVKSVNGTTTSASKETE